MTKKEYYGMSCNFCNFQCFRETGFFGGAGESREIFRCPDCGTVLCENCTDSEKHFKPIGSTLKAGLAVATMGVSLIGTGLRMTDKKCLKCGSKRLREVKA
jgi:hypothetical protein